LSITGEREKYAEKEEIVEYLKRRIEELENEIRILRSILARIDPTAVGPAEEEARDPSERVEEVRVGKRTVAIVGMGSDYVRLKFKFPAVIPEEIREYIESVVAEIAERQAIDGVPPDERARLELKTAPDGTVSSIYVVNLGTTLEKVKTKAALKYVAELVYQIHRKRDRE